MAIHGYHIGINYAGTQSALRGCINDAHDWAAWVQSIGGNRTLLLESEATKANILAGIAGVLAKLKPNDWGVITFSGHGTQVPDGNGEESDRKDEALCPFDLNRHLLTDDELANAFSDLPQGARLLFVSDCCHSGTLTRGPILDSPLPHDLARFVPFETLCTEMCLATIDRVHQEVRAARMLPRAKTLSLLHMAGCQDDQSSYDATLGGKACGAFSYFALASLKGKPQGFTFDQWRTAVRPYLPSNRYPQSPQFNGMTSWVVPGFEPPSAAEQPIASTVETFEGKTSRGRVIRGVIE